MENTRAELYTEEQDKKQIKSRSPEEPDRVPGRAVPGRQRSAEEPDRVSGLPARAAPEGNRSPEEPENLLALPSGTVLDGRYRVVRVLRQGGFGITYEGVHIQSGGRVAVKEYFCREICVRLPETYAVTSADSADLPRFEEDRARFLREARILREFAQEPSVVTVLDYFEENGTAYIVMEYLGAKTLREEIRKGGTWSMETIARRFGPVMEVLARIHAAGVLHRDISPGNLMVMPDGKLKLIDFGAARELGNADRTHSAIYTRGYSAPEQRDEKGILGSWTDVYGLCGLFWFCLTGRDPEDAQSRLLYDELERPSSLGGEISPAAEQLLMRGLELDSSMRIRDVETLRQALEKLYPSLTEEERREREAGKRRKLRAAAIAGCFLLFAAACLAFIFRTEILFFFIDTQVVGLDGSHMTQEQFEDSSSKVRQRVEALTGKGRYRWKEEEDQHITFEVPKASFGDTDPDTFVKMLLTRPMIMRIYAEVPDQSGQEENSDSVKSGSGEVEVSAGVPDQSGQEENSASAQSGSGDKTAPAAEADSSAAEHSALPFSDDKRDDGKKTGDLVSFSFDPDAKYRYMGIFRQDKTVLDVSEVSDRIKLTLRQEAAADLAGFLNKKGQRFLFCFDEFDENGTYRMEHSFSRGQAVGDGKNILFPGGNSTEYQPMKAPFALMRLLYREAPSSAAFYVQCKKEARWERVESALLPGKNQTDEDKIRPPFLQLQYDSRYSLPAAEESGYTSAVLSIHAVIKNRLDSLGIPYAVGTDPEDSARIFIRIPRAEGLYLEELENMGENMARDWGLGSRNARRRTSFYATSFSVQETGEGAWQLLMSPDGNDLDTVEETLQTLLEQGEEEIFLYDLYRPLAAGNVQEAIRSLEENGTIAFTRWTFSEYQAMDAKTLAMGRFLMTCFGQNPENSYRLAASQTQEEDGRIRFFYEGLPDRIDRDHGDKWAQEQDLPWKSAKLSYRRKDRSLRVTLYEYPLDRPGECLEICRRLFDGAEDAGVKLNELSISCYEKAADTPGVVNTEEVYLVFSQDFEAGSMILDHGIISGFSKEDPEQTGRAESLKSIYYHAFDDSDCWRNMLTEEAREKKEEIFFIPD